MPVTVSEVVSVAGSWSETWLPLLDSECHQLQTTNNVYWPQGPMMNPIKDLTV